MQDIQSGDGICGLGTGMTSGLIDKMTWVTLPDAQLLTSDLPLVEPDSLVTDEALQQDPIYKTKCILTTHVSSVFLSEVAAAREGSSYKNLIVKVIEVNQLSDGVKVRYTGDTLSLEKAFQCGLIPASVYISILQRQKEGQDMIYSSTAEKVPLFESELEAEPCEVNRLILNCFSRNKSLTSGRNIKTLSAVCDGLSDRETLGEHFSAGYDDRLTVDACVQCDLMNSSSTLVILGNQCHFIGLVLPRSEEIQTVSSSYRYDQQITTEDFSSRLLSNQQKIAALYIPEDSEVVDITFAAQSGFIDSYTAEVLKSIEIPDVFPDVDALKEKFSSWLMYKKLTADGCHHAADGIETENVLIPTEERHLFISYLMMNSYIDPKSGQRVLVLDNQMTKMVQLFLEDLKTSENPEKNGSSLTLNVCDVSEQTDLETSLCAQKNTQHTFNSHDFISSANAIITPDENMQLTCDPHFFVSSENGGITFNEDAYVGDKILKQDPVGDLSDIEEPEGSEQSMFQNNTNWTKLDKCLGSIRENTLTIDAVDTENEALDIPTSLEMSVIPSLCCVKSTNVDSSKMCDAETSVKALPRYDADSLCSKSRNINLYSRDLVESENEQDRAISLLKAQLEEGGILDVTSGRRYELEEALKKGLVDETTVLRMLDSQTDEKEGLIGEEEGPLSVLKQSDGSISSKITLSIMEHQKLLRPDCTDSSHPISVDHSLHLIKLNEAENIQQPTDSEVAVMVLDVTRGEEGRKGKQIENRDASDCVMRGNVQGARNYLPQPTSSGHGMSSLSSWSQVTAECIHHADASPSLAADGFSQERIDSVQLNGADVTHVVTENAVTSHPSSLNDRTCISDPQKQSQNVFSTVKSSDSSRIDNGLCDGKKRNQTVSDSDLDVSSLLCNVLFEDDRTGNDKGAAHSSLDSELAPNIDYSSHRDLVESALTSVPRDDWRHDKNRTVDGSRTAFSQQAGLCPESDFIVETEPRCSLISQIQLNNSMPLPEVSTVGNNSPTKTLCHRSCDIENSSNSVSPETVPTNKDLLDSEHSGAVDDTCMERFSPERQHVDSFSDTDEMFVSRNEKEHGNVSVTYPSSGSSSFNSSQSEKLGPDTISDRERPDVQSSENPQVIHSFQSDSSTTSDVASVMTGPYEQGEIIPKGTHVSDFQKAQTQDTERPVTVDQNSPQPSEKACLYERDTPQDLVERSHADLQMDLLTQNTLGLNNNTEENPELMLQEEDDHEIEQSDSPHIQLQLLQVLRTVSSSQDLSVLQEVMDTLNSALGGDSYGEQWHTLETIREENSEDGSPELSPQTSAEAVAYKVGEVKQKVYIMLFQY